MEEHTREATLPHINGNVVRQWGPRLVTMIRALSTDLRPVFAFFAFLRTNLLSAGWETFLTFYGICMEEHTWEARLPHINGNVVRK